ncbi:MAG: hypothetical protein J5I90_04055 [Caldilineales bacterium]|nr:hypothetical protein [Caldilineales bacterium]
MNVILRDYYPLFEYYQALRTQLMELLADSDLAFRLDGNPSLGALCREIGDVQQAYARSFQSFTIEFGRSDQSPEIENSVSGLQDWYAEMDRRLRTNIEALSDEDCHDRKIDRGGWEVSPQMQLEIYKEALLIFYGKVSVYLKTMGKTLPEQWADWIG